MRPVIEANHSGFNTWALAQVSADTPLAGGPRAHWERTKQETVRASSYISERGTAVGLGAGAFIVFPLVELLKERLPDGTLKYENIVLVEIAPEISKRARK